MAGYRPYYRVKEENTILEAIVVTRSYLKLRSRNFWKDLEASKMVNPRTWQSMKERFDKHILPNLYSKAYTIPILEKKLISLGYLQTQMDFDPKKFETAGLPDSSEDSSASDEI